MHSPHPPSLSTFRLRSPASWIQHSRAFHVTAVDRDIIKVPAFADSVSEGDVR